ncbi:unnamed protein product, partial [Cyprideis torosa]
MAYFNAVETQVHLNDCRCNLTREELIALSSMKEDNWGTSVNSRTEKIANTKETILESEGRQKKFESQSDLACQKKNHTGEESYSCEICSWKFCTIDDLELHSLLHTVEVSSNCQQFDQLLGSEDDSRKVRVAHEEYERILYNRENLHICSFCGKTFETISNCKEHERRHMDENKYKCSFCEKRFQHEKMADFNAVKTHENLNDIQCNPIGEELTAFSAGNEENWRTSVNSRTQESTNPEKTIYEIEGFARGFESQSDLAYQDKNPPIEESYSCEICSWKFCTFEDFELHSLLHTVEVSSNCQQFDQPLGSEDDSRKGRMTQEEYERILYNREKLHICSFCGKTFEAISNCREHERRHMDEKKYKCSFCEKRFQHESSCRMHERFHTRKNLY